MGRSCGMHGRNVYWVLVGKLEGKRPLAASRDGGDELQVLGPWNLLVSYCRYHAPALFKIAFCKTSRQSVTQCIV
jgi:hypothetical protein